MSRLPVDLRRPVDHHRRLPPITVEGDHLPGIIEILGAAVAADHDGVDIRLRRHPLDRTAIPPQDHHHLLLLLLPVDIKAVEKANIVITMTETDDPINETMVDDKDDTPFPPTPTRNHEMEIVDDREDPLALRMILSKFMNHPGEEKIRRAFENRLAGTRIRTESENPLDETKILLESGNPLDGTRTPAAFENPLDVRKIPGGFENLLGDTRTPP
mmetsp:Transcript_4012/g.10220  ORF Transcript_4012/g.10220 Transcript_4012/m.10220 type:complete len:215 (-) Transcript_4012:878-1522(-)